MNWIEGHAHILPAGLDLLKLNLSNCQTAAEVLSAVAERHREQPDGWLHAVQYDQTKYDGIHLTKHDLDVISSTRPILLRHSNGHASVANSAALALAGVTESTPDPAGGSYRRDASGAPDGVLLERAHEFVTNASPNPGLEEMIQAILRAGESMAADGISLSCDMMTGRFNLAQELEAYRIAGERGCKIETRLYVQWSTIFGKRGHGPDFLKPYADRVRGIKIFADGAIGSATAAIYGSYEGQPTAETSGQLIYSPERLNDMVKTADAAGFQVAVHAIGDYATDLVMNAFSQCPDPSKHRLEHAMILSDAQIERLAKLGCFVTMQPEFLMRFGHSYRRQLGEQRASMLKRARSCIDAGIPISFSSDRPIVPGNPADGVRTAVNRPAGFSPAENISEAEAINAYTIENLRLIGEL